MLVCSFVRLFFGWLVRRMERKKRVDGGRWMFVGADFFSFFFFSPRLGFTGLWDRRLSHRYVVDSGLYCILFSPSGGKGL